MDEQSRVYVKNLVHIFEKKRVQKQPETTPTDHAIRIQSKYNELSGLMGRTEDIASILHRENHLSDEERSDIVSLQFARLRANEVLLDLLKRKPRDAYAAFLAALNETNQQHLVQILVSETETRSRRDLEEISPVDGGDRAKVARKDRPAHAVLIGHLYDWLTDALRANDGLVAVLHRDGVLTDRERGLMDGETNRFRRTQLLLAIVSKKTDDEFRRFLNGLEETGQVKVADRFKGLDVTTDQNNIHSSSSPVLRLSKTQPHHRVAPRAIPVFTRSRKAQCSKAQRSLSLETTEQNLLPSPNARDIKEDEAARVAPKTTPRNTGRTTKPTPRHSLPMGEENAAGTGTMGPVTPRSLKINDVLERLQSSLKENEELRFRLTSAKTNEKLLEVALQKLRNELQECKKKNDCDADGQLKKLKSELEEKTVRIRELETSKEELDQTRVHLANEVEINRRRETLLVESSAKIRELLERCEELEKRLRQSRNENQNQDANVELLQEVSKEKHPRRDQEEHLCTPGEEIQLLEKEIIPGGQDIESSLRSQLEEVERRGGGEKFQAIERKKQERESDFTGTVKDNILSKPDSEQIISELSAALASAREEISSLKRQLEDNKGRQETRRPTDDDDDNNDEMMQLQLQLPRGKELIIAESSKAKADVLKTKGVSSERSKEEDIQTQILEQVQTQLKEALRLKARQDKDLEDLQATCNIISARLCETEWQLRDKSCEINKLFSEICDEKRRREAVELALNEAQETILSLRRNESDKGKSQEQNEGLLSRLNEETTLRKEADRKLREFGEETALLKQRNFEQEALLCQANRDNEMLSLRLLEAGKDAQRMVALGKRLTDANAENDFLSKQVEELKHLRQNADKEIKDLMAKIEDMETEAVGTKSSLERRLQEAEQNMRQLKQHSGNQESLLQQIGNERNALVEKLAQMGNENQTKRELSELLEAANDQISSLKKQNNEILDRQKSEAEQMASKIRQDREEYESLEKGFKECELQLNRLLKDVSHERMLKFEQQQKLDAAKGTIADLAQRLEAAENYSELRTEYSEPRTEYSSTTAPPNDTANNEPSTATQQQQQQQQLDELSKELKEKESELWRVKKELAKERLQNKKNFEKSLAAAACERRLELNPTSTPPGRTGPRTDPRIPAQQQHPFRTARPTLRNYSGPRPDRRDPTDADCLGLVSSGPPLNLRIFVERPKRKKNHAAKSSAGLLAREAPTADGKEKEEEEPSLPHPLRDGLPDVAVESGD